MGRPKRKVVQFRVGRREYMYMNLFYFLLNIIPIPKLLDNWADETKMFGSKITPSGQSTGNPFAPNPFGVPSNLGSSFTMPNASGTTSGVVGTTYSPFPTLGSQSVPAFGGSASVSGFYSAPALSFSSSGPSAFGQKPVFGASNTTGAGFSSTPTVGQWTMVFGRSDLLGATKSSFDTQSSFSGSQVSTPPFGSQTKGSRVATYARTSAKDPMNQVSVNLESITAMPIFQDKSHEELRWEDYQSGDKGGFVSGNFNPKQNAFSSVSASMTPFNTSTSNIFAIPNVTSCATCPTFTSSFNSLPSKNPFLFTPPSTNSAFSVFSSSSFTNSITTSSCSPSPSVTMAPSPFGPTSSSSLVTSVSFPTPVIPFPLHKPPIFNESSLANFLPKTSIYTTTVSASSVFSSPSFTNSLSTSSFPSSSSVTPPASPFGPSTSSLVQPSSLSALPVNPVPFPDSANHFPLQTPPINGSSFANFPSTTSLYTPTTITVSAPSSFVSSPSFSPSISALEFSPGLSFTYNQPTSLLHSSGPSFHSSIRGVTVAEAGGLDNIAQGIGSQTKATGQQISGVNPFGSLPPMTKMSIGGPGSSPTVRYGISSLPVQEKHAPVRMSSLVTYRHVSRRNRLPVQKYDPKINGPKVPFFMDDREIPVSLFVPRENPRALVIRPIEHWPLRTNSEKFPGIEDKLSSTHIYDNGENFSGNVDTYSEKPKMEHVDDALEERNSPLKRHDDEELLPKLQLSGYYTEPRIQELAALERTEPGFCSHVKNFVVGRHGYGSIKFTGETDVRSLDLESIFEFNNREVIVYKDENKKPGVGKGLNKPAEVTLLNIKCFDKKTGDQYMDGPRAEKYREMLKKKAEEQGAEFVSYDPVEGEWKFRVDHF